MDSPIRLSHESLRFRSGFALVLMTFCLSGALSNQGLADIQDPPMNDQGPIRKLSRGLANLFGGSTEVFVTWEAKNSGQGNSAAAFHGVVDGVWRTLMRMGAGFYEVVTFPVPTMRGSYASPLPSCAPWVNNGYEEFPPELGFESRFPYTRVTGYQSRLP
jgi:putative exosortase-associated protein (TIGR04073 family)